MQIFEENDSITPIYHRAMSLSFSKDFADPAGKPYSSIDKQNSEQEHRRRELLAVEEQAKQARIVEAYGQAHFKSQTMAKFYSKVSAKINNEFDDHTALYHNILGIEDTAPAIMEILTLKAASINRIAPLVNSLPWLADELIKLVNKPQYRKRADVQVTDGNLALSYVGLENLKLVMPTFMLKHWLPVNTAPFVIMKRKIWNDSVAIALGCQLLAKDSDIDSFSAFTAGMFSNIGIFAVARCFFQTFNDMHKDALKQAYLDKDKRLHDTLTGIEMSPELLHEQLIERSSKITADMVELMRFDRLPITEPLFDIAYITDLDKMSTIAQLVIKVKAYIMQRNLAKEELISASETKQLFKLVRLSSQELKKLQSNDIDHIKLNFS
ncbi:histidine kinase [Thalassotalea insulae]|uniref:Histidine kinase n=1 Tax=Thalassotalea insulae TaxID=2056778 RepID=A0ABQ6GTP8_9GAMM|nr:HDOD domain-containing protein [Thalassotalea insulae]GLX78032.1 histidine kinase [Thalassotalea insulae]